RIAHGDLAIASDYGLAVLAHADDGGSVPDRRGRTFGKSVHGPGYGSIAARLQARREFAYWPAPAPGMPTWPILPNRSSRKPRSLPRVGVSSPSGLIRATCSMPERSARATLPASSKCTARTLCVSIRGRPKGACFVVLET